MDELPDDVLVVVMAYLSVKDVLACREVCKRLADVALLADVWRHRSIGRERYLRCVCPVLRLAPRVDSLVLILQVPLRCRRLPRSVRCAVREFDFHVESKGAQQAARFIRQQRVFGELRVVSLDCNILDDSVKSANNVAMLLRTLASMTPGLETLAISGSVSNAQPPASAVPERCTVTPSLKRFTCILNSEMQCFCSYVLAAHAATLEEVVLSTDITDDILTPLPADLLAGMPSLRKLSCHSLPGLAGVAACESLTDLRLDVRSDSSLDLAAIGLLRSVTDRLRSLYLSIPAPGFAVHHSRELLLTLTSPRWSKLESLSIGLGYGYATVQPLLLQVLPLRLPTLRRLRVNTPSEELLQLINPTTAPSLQIFQIQGHADEEFMRFMCFRHERVRALLATNPSLHVELHPVLFRDVCESCGKDCYSLPETLSLLKTSFTTVFAHPKHKCPYPEVHGSVGRWFHIDDVKR